MKAISLIFGLAILCISPTISAQGDIVDLAVSSKEHSTLVAAIKAADLVSTLKGEGPFTVFAPTNSAFDKLPAGTLEALLKPEAKNKLTTILTYHVIAGDFAAADVIAAIKNGGGNFTIKTVVGGILTAKIENGNVVLEDEQGNIATITQTDLKASNGVIHVINGVLLPQ